MYKDILRKYDRFDTLEGYAEIEEVNAEHGRAWCVEYNHDDEVISKSWLTTHDVAKRLREVDGKNRIIRFE